ncbi:MAG: hypothetical protein IPM37_08590 [Hahellaceae bacterium]|nr:hypothetical protein [Hahellaceae bacterium]
MKTARQHERLRCAVFVSAWLAPTQAYSQSTDLQQALDAVAGHHPACKTAQPFYWEVGNAHGVLAKGQVGLDAPDADTVMPIASATKWLFGAYVVETRQGKLSEADIQTLTMRAGYVEYKHRLCVKHRQAKQDDLTVAECFAESGWGAGHNDALSADAVGMFYYAGGHFQHWGVENGLGSLNSGKLGQAFNNRLGANLAIGFESPQLAGGARMTARHYGDFLRKLLSGELALSAYLGKHAVCAQPSVCPQQALKSPIPSNLAWHYSLGHWVETGSGSDGAYSSGGAFGFYPWISADQQHYGVLARMKKPSLKHRPARDSAACGQQLRSALRSVNGA